MHILLNGMCQCDESKRDILPVLPREALHRGIDQQFTGPIGAEGDRARSSTR